MKKDFRSMAAPIVGIVCLAAGAFAGFDTTQVDTLKGALDGIIGIVATLVGLYGVWKSHEKK